MTGIVTISPSREKPILNRHPWVFSGAIQDVQDAAPGTIVDVVTHKGEFLARGYWNPKSQIQVRILTWQDEPIDDVWWQRQLKQAIESRAAYHHPTEPRGYRLINAENDYIPGLVVDRYGDYLVLQALTLYIDQQKQQIALQLTHICQQLNMPIKGIYERSDVDVRKKEGLGLTTGVLWGEEPPELVEVISGDKVRLIDIRHGHKTGYYLDQQHNQNMLPRFLATHGLNSGHTRILNLFSYTGGFGLATQGHVTNVDASRPALELAEATYQRNQWPEERVDFIQADIFDFLRDQAENGEQYDVVILDPPKFAHHKRQIDAAARGYKDLNMYALRAVRQCGFLLTFSCSGAISPDLFQKIVFGALVDSRRQAQIIRHLEPSPDHPVALTFPEGAYLKGLLLRVF